MTEDLRWQYFRQDEIPEALFGFASQSQLWTSQLDLHLLRGGRIAIGFLERDRGYVPPSIIVLSKEASAENFSWLKVYAPETSPISQFSRIITEADWVDFSGLEKTVGVPVREDRWSSVVLGELLAQAEVGIDATAIPISRAASCFTTCIARASIIYGFADATRICAERIRRLENAPHFVKRPIVVDDLLPVWALVGADLADLVSPPDCVDLIVDAAWSALPKSVNPSRFTPRSLKEAHGLYSDSAEQRVVTFNQFAADISRTASSDSRNRFLPVLLAAAAFLVGRGTSHAFLLRKSGGASPMAFVWFGLMAALAGPSVWDLHWSRISKGIERSLRSKFDWTDPSGPDLYWAEYEWLAQTHTGLESFSGLPKNLSNALSVEVVPGAQCQLRFTPPFVAQVDGKPTEDRSSRNETVRESEALAILSQFISLAAKAKSILDVSASPAQKTLSFGEEGKESKIRPRRGRRD